MLAPAMLDARRVLRKHKPVARLVSALCSGADVAGHLVGRVPNVIFEPNAERLHEQSASENFYTNCHWL